MLQADASKVSTRAKKRGLPQVFILILNSLNIFPHKFNVNFYGFVLSSLLLINRLSSNFE